MDNKLHIHNKAEKALSSLDNIQRATPTPFFYTRLMANLSTRAQTTWEKFGSFITHPSIAFAGICLIILINAMAAYSHLNTSATTDQSDVTVTEEYTQVATNFYDYENIKP
ncbi:MAG: hypothetical protein M3004_00940 [Bacteroidota bacterium]|nr:hypothetical protein [Bacteroidota bacterium]